MTWIIWIYRLLKRENLWNFVLTKYIFILFLKRSLKILLKFLICFCSNIFIIHIFIVDVIKVMILIILFFIILLRNIEKIDFWIIEVIQRRASNVLLRHNRVLVFLDFHLAEFILGLSIRLSIINIFLLIRGTSMLFSRNMMFILILLLGLLLIS